MSAGANRKHFLEPRKSESQLDYIWIITKRYVWAKEPLTCESKRLFWLLFHSPRKERLCSRAGKRFLWRQYFSSNYNSGTRVACEKRRVFRLFFHGEWVKSRQRRLISQDNDKQSESLFLETSLLFSGSPSKWSCSWRNFFVRTEKRSTHQLPDSEGPLLTGWKRFPKKTTGKRTGYDCYMALIFTETGSEI